MNHNIIPPCSFHNHLSNPDESTQLPEHLEQIRCHCVKLVAENILSEVEKPDFKEKTDALGNRYKINNNGNIFRVDNISESSQRFTLVFDPVDASNVGASYTITTIEESEFDEDWDNEYSDVEIVPVSLDLGHDSNSNSAA